MAQLEKEKGALEFRCDAAEARGDALQAHQAEVSQMHAEEISRLKGESLDMSQSLQPQMTNLLDRSIINDQRASGGEQEYYTM